MGKAKESSRPRSRLLAVSTIGTLYHLLATVLLMDRGCWSMNLFPIRLWNSTYMVTLFLAQIVNSFQFLFIRLLHFLLHASNSILRSKTSLWLQGRVGLSWNGNLEFVLHWVQQRDLLTSMKIVRNPSSLSSLSPLTSSSFFLSNTDRIYCFVFICRPS